ncbi:MAG: SDR family oxidoreductase [Planctomycetia bacterium]|nr:SDR family oxidoreductase [Planctomycetia bacterium]
MDFLVTGGAGFIGSHLVHRLVELGHSVRVLDDLSSGKRENLVDVLSKTDWIQGDMADPAIARRACRGVDVVLHEAAVPSVPKSVDDPATSHRSNVEGTFQLLLAARDEKVRRFIYAGSSSAYGESPTLPKVESMPTDPLSPYAVQKLTGEFYCRAFARCYGLQTLTMRYFNVFGPRQDPRSQYAAAIPAFVTAILQNRAPTVYGDGEQTRDFTYIENVIHANLLAAKAERTNGEVVNIACGGRISINQIIADINRYFGKSIKPDYLPERQGDIKHSAADISLARKVIGYQPIVSTLDGLKRTMDWYAARIAI